MSTLPMPELLAKLRSLAERRQKLTKQLAELDGELARLIGMPTSTRKSPRLALDRETADRLIRQGGAR